MDKVSEAKIKGKYVVIAAIITASATILAVTIPLLVNRDTIAPVSTPTIATTLTPIHTPMPSTSITATLPSTPSVQSRFETVTVEEEETASVFGGELFITVNDIVYPNYNRVSFTVGTPGYPNQVIENAEIGHTTVYESNHRYDIRVARTMEIPEGILFVSRGAEFLVTQLDED